MPLGVQGHHAMIDGVHVGKFYEVVEDYLQNPETLLGQVSGMLCVWDQLIQEKNVWDHG